MKNFKINSQNKLNVVKISITCFFIIILFIIALQVSFATDSIVSSITIKSNALAYSSDEGSWQVTETAKWIAKGTARIDLSLTTKKLSKSKAVDLVLLLDDSLSDDTLKISYELFYKWNGKFTDLLGLFEELKHQFSFAFPIFNLPESSEESNYISGDCILQQNLTAEIDLPPLPQPQIQNPYNTNINNVIIPNKEKIVIKRHNNSTYSNDFVNIASPNTNSVSPSRQVRVQSVPKSESPVVVVNPKPVQTEVKLDEEVIKFNLSQLVIKNILPKIKREIRANFSTTLRLENVKSSINKKIEKLSNIEKKNEELTVTVQKMQKDLDNYNIPLPGKYDLTNLSNLDSLLNIPFKTTYEFQSREKSLDELILLIKKAYEKGTIDFPSAIKLIRMNSRNLFFIKYKAQSVCLYNK